MDGGEQLERCLYYLDSRATEGEGAGGEVQKKTLSSSSERSYARRHIN